MHKYGLKFWSTNKHYFEPTKKLLDTGLYQYVELYIVPGTYKKTINKWKSLKTGYVIHAPNYPKGLNLADKRSRIHNLKIMKEVIQFADALKSKIIIVHPGTAGDIKETGRQIKTIKDKRIIVENKPYKSLYGGLVCNGSSPEEIKHVMTNAGIGFCLDISHAICSANSHKEAPVKYIKKFIELRPKMFHMTDGKYSETIDSHLHFGDGNFPIKKILRLIPKNSMITIEAAKDSKKNLNDCIRDMEYLRKIT